MNCHKCNKMCVQYKELGQNKVSYSYYHNIEVKMCPDCNTKYFEVYALFDDDPEMIEINLAEIGDCVKHLKTEIDRIEGHEPEIPTVSSITSKES